MARDGGTVVSLASFSVVEGRPTSRRLVIKGILQFPFIRYCTHFVSVFVPSSYCHCLDHIDGQSREETRADVDLHRYADITE